MVTNSLIRGKHVECLLIPPADEEEEETEKT